MKRLLFAFGVAPAMLVAQTPPITLDQALREAIASNLDLAAARHSISVAEARQITARLRPNPVMTVSADHLDLLGTGYNSINNAGPNEYSYRTDFILERGGKRTARMELAAVEKSVTELGFQDTMRRLIFDVESAFVDVQLARENLALAEDNLRSLNGIVAINTVRVRTGDLAVVELDRSQVAAMQYQTAVRQAELQLRQARNRLQFLLGRPVAVEDFDVTGPIRRDDRRISLEEVRGRAQTRRPDLQAIRQTQARNQADLRLQLAQGKIDYTTGVEYRRQQAPSGMGNSLGFFFSAPLPLFNRNQGEIARSQREIDQAAAQIRALEARVNGEVTSTWHQYFTSRGLLEDIEQKMLAKARSVRQTTEYSYRRGEATLVEFLDAQRAFNDVTQSYNEARANYARSLYLLDSVTASPVSIPGPAQP
ncbi:MAG: TolC family protein [Acidobacteria bacterium]|nr:TolC family protein [Acidobacteriota bacterium]